MKSIKNIGTLKLHSFFSSVYFLINLFFLCATPLLAQTCFPDGIRFTSQNEIDNFAIEYPGCFAIEGSLIIGDPDYPYDDSDIQNLDGLSQITAISGNIVISGNEFLTSIDGLQNLTIIKGDLEINSNKILSSVRGLENIKEIMGSLILSFNCSCLQLFGLENLEVIRGDFEIKYGSFNGLFPLNKIDSIYGDFRAENSSFTNFVGVNSLRYLGGTLVLSSTQVENFTGLENLTELGGLYLYRNDNVGMTGLHNVTIIHDDLYLSENDNVSLSPLGNTLSTIGGDLYVNMSNAGTQFLTALKRIGGSLFYLRNHLASSFSGPPNLEYLGGWLNIYQNNLMTSISGFPKLDTIGGTVHIYLLPQLKSISIFPNLKVLSGEYFVQTNKKLETIINLDHLKVLGGLIIESNDILSNVPEFPILEELNGQVKITFNDKIKIVRLPHSIIRMPGTIEFFGNDILKSVTGFNNLTSIGGDFLFWLNSNIDTIAAFESLDSVGGELYVELSQAISDFPRNNRFEFIGGDISLHQLNIVDLSCLQELDSIPGSLSISICHNMTSLLGIEDLISLGGLSLATLRKLPNLNDLENLTWLGGELSITNCDSLSNIDALEGITSIEGRLHFSSNDHLENIQGVRHIDPENILAEYPGFNDIEIYNNPKLSVCNLPNICSAVRDYKRSFQIEQNAPGCDDVRELDCKDYGFSGTVYFDSNQNKIQDINEHGVPGVKVTLQPGQRSVDTNEEGNFLVLASEEEAQVLKMESPENWLLTTDSSQYTRLFFAGSASNSDLDFGISTDINKNDLSVNLSSDATRCNETVTFYIRYQNSGTTPLKGRIKLVFNDDVSYSTATQSPFNSQYQSPNLIYQWRFDTLQPFDFVDIKVYLRMPSQLHAGEVYDFNLIALIDSAGNEVIKDVFVYSPTIVCSFDPNDKIVTPPGVRQENFTLLDEKLTYTIRFQNTGNAHAVDITLLDTIDASMDLTTLKVVNSSFPVYTTIDGQAVMFFFENIWLPDSLSNESDSHGFVTYEISPINGMADFTEVKNEANIIFDFNDPILTNETLNTFVEEICNDRFFEIDTVICDGTSYAGYTATGVYSDTIKIGSTCDSISWVDLTVIQVATSLDSVIVCEGSSVVIHGKEYIAETTGYIADTLYSVEGCPQDIDSVYVNVLPAGLPPCLTNVNEPSNLAFRVYPNPISANGKLQIELQEKNNPIDVILMIRDAHGRMVKTSKHLSTKSFTQELSDMGPGLYTLIIYTNETYQIEKIVIQ